MTPLVDDLTAALIAVLFGLIAIITIYEAWHDHHPGEIITGLAAVLVAIVYIAPLAFNVPVVEIRSALRAALTVYSLNYIISHRDILALVVRAIVRRTKLWIYHRS